MTSPAPSRDTYDAVVVGARCAGAATAMLLARDGLRVLALERTAYGSDTLSTHALMRAGVLQLSRWGVLPAVMAAATPPIRRTWFHYGEEVIEVAIKARDGVESLIAPRRTVLDTLLVDAARAAGAEIVHHARVVDLRRGADGGVTGVLAEGPDGSVTEVGAGVVIGADGARSTVARLAGARTTRTAANASGVIYGYWHGLELGGTHWHYAPGVGAGAIPTNDGAACVFAATPTARFRAEMRGDIGAGYGRLLRECSMDLGERVAGASPAGAMKAFAGAAGFLRQAWGPGWALVGDAGYFKDPITAHGMTDALRDAELLARAVVQGSPAALAAYEAERDALAVPFLELTDRIASYAWTLDEVKVDHKLLSREMNREVEAILRLAGGPGTELAGAAQRVGPAPAPAATAPPPAA